MRWKALAIVLLALSFGSLAISLANREQTLPEVGWTSYTPFADVRDGGRVYELGHTVDTYSLVTSSDAILWLGLAMGFGAAALLVGVAAFWPRRGAAPSAHA